MASSINAYLGYKVGLTGMLIGAIVYLGIEFRGFCINRKVDASRINRKVGASDR